jgi:aryl-alcohol dehydrogenase-like predicted oxidoreductase
MRLVKLFGTELEVSPVCLGAASFGRRLDRDTAFEFLDRFVAAGGNFIDTASLYCRDFEAGISRSEEIIGQYLKERGGSPLVVATKGAHYDLKTKEKRVNRACIEADLDESLRTLGKETIDLYWLHRDDTDKPVEEIVDIMEGFVRAGKIRYYGASNYSFERLTAANKYAKASGGRGFCAVSNYWTMLKENEGFPLSADSTLVGWKNSDLKRVSELGIPLIPFSSTAKGWLAKGVDNATERLNLVFDNAENRALREEMIKKAESEGCPLQTAFLRAMSKYGEDFGLQIIPITSCGSISQLEELLEF